MTTAHRGGDRAPGRAARRHGRTVHPDPADITASLGHIATRQQLLAAGCRGVDLTRAVRSGALTRVRQARYATVHAPREALAAVRVGGMLAGVSAARTYGLWGGQDRRVHVSVASNAARLHATRVAFDDDVDDRYRMPVVIHHLRGGGVPELGPECWRVPLNTCLKQVVRWSDPETAVACLDTARSRFTLDELRTVFRATPARNRLLVERSRPGSDSGIESIVRQRLAAGGITVRQQVAITGVGRVDMLIGRLVIEVDGAAFHSDAQAFERDRHRDALLVGMGFRVVRLTYTRVLRHWPECLAVVTAALDR